MKRTVSAVFLFFLIFCKPPAESVEDRVWEPLFESLTLLSYPYLINTCAVSPTFYYGPVSPIQEGYGSRGSRSVSSFALQNPSAPRNVCVYYPSDVSSKVPVLFLIHGFSSPSAEAYYPLIDFYVSKGYAVVFPIYISDRRDPNENYKIMLDGIDYAVGQFDGIMDTTRVGYLGHSYGGGATPYLAHQGIIMKGWGSNGSFIFLSAPWYSFAIDDTQLGQFTDSTKLIVQIYDTDDVVDNRMAIDIFTNIGIGASEKNFQILNSQTYQGYLLNADHYTPIKNTVIGLGNLDALDYHGVWKQLEALAEYSFNGSSSAKNIALGNGSAEQIYMGAYSDGTPVQSMTVTNTPTPLHPENYFEQPFSDSLNPRF
ncbi:alpha/beta hydrolase [Leptospira gomenensis]|uniref:Alpha/beta hydrolase n=1 Tax=Leptospira gomenensis TaxID=2484974 RepID=A0A5F1Y6R4_9LEPT|nr:alpha/beta hydrolase [Leptospira gomenensis]TGK27926.1 alpha/beta hydrolase [Leptospira gomenensis]TGK45468.1 alpha/beta hydrolase [Leptospira gomenensis]TGK45855.1 alpha/beta hydrolase [Leptospira gomenensis]TGK65219.1 alpha/beta hydrolase [Leptospira gomenensis]